jgi:hypothetical protein
VMSVAKRVGVVLSVMLIVRGGRRKRDRKTERGVARIRFHSRTSRRDEIRPLSGCCFTEVRCSREPPFERARTDPSRRRQMFTNGKKGRSRRNYYFPNSERLTSNPRGSTFNTQPREMSQLHQTEFVPTFETRLNNFRSSQPDQILLLDDSVTTSASDLS